MKKIIFFCSVIFGLSYYFFFFSDTNTETGTNEIHTDEVSVRDSAPNVMGSSFIDLRSDWQKYVPDMYNWSEILPPIQSQKALGILAEIRIFLQKKDQKRLEELDSLTQRLISDSAISRHDKIGVLWKIIQEFGVDTEIGQYMLDTIASLHPLEITREITTLFDTTNNINTKKSILILVTTLFALDTNQIEGNMPRIEYLRKRQKTIQDFLKKQFTEVGDKDLLETLLRYYPLALNEDQTLVEYAESALKRNQDLFTPEVFTELYFGLISGQSGREKEFDGLLEMAKSEKSIAQVVNNQLYLGLSGPDAEMFLSTQSKEWKEAVKTYIASQKPSKSDFGDIHMFAFEFGRWTQASIELSEGTRTSKLSSMLGGMSPFEQALFISHIMNTRQMTPEDASVLRRYAANITTNSFSLPPNERGLVEEILSQFGSFGQ